MRTFSSIPIDKILWPIIRQYQYHTIDYKLVMDPYLNECFLSGFLHFLQPDKLQDLSLVIMEELRRLACRVSDEEVIRAQNKVSRKDLSARENFL